MACNMGKGPGCKDIANKYTIYVEDISQSVSSIKINLSKIKSELESLSVPNDYLGEKVKSRLESICSNFSSDESSIDGAFSSIESFANEKKNDHMQHEADYQEYLRMLAEIEKEKQKNRSSSYGGGGNRTNTSSNMLK